MENVGDFLVRMADIAGHDTDNGHAFLPMDDFRRLLALALSPRFERAQELERARAQLERLKPHAPA